MNGYSTLAPLKKFKCIADESPYTDKLLFNKLSIAVLLGVATILSAPTLGPIATFIVLDTLLATYLVSLFQNKYSFFFLIHPIFILLTSYGFKIPYTQIGVSGSYMYSFYSLIDPSSLNLNSQKAIEQIFFQEEHLFGFAKTYVSTIPIIWIPNYLFNNPPKITIYLSLGCFTLLYTAIAVSISLIFRIFRKNILLIIALYSTVSPTFLEINSSLHRYGLLSLGLFLFLISYVGLLNRPHRYHFCLILIMISSIFFIGVSKAPIFFSILLFLFLDRLSLNKLPLISAVLKRQNNATRILTVLFLMIFAQYLATFIVPEKYVLYASQKGGQYNFLSNIPLIGLALRLVYAMLSPFPWINFPQWGIYGYNNIFLLVHIFSSLLASWIILSFFANLRGLLKSDDETRICIVFGAAIMSSLAFASIGYHVYLAPALPFLSTVLSVKRYRLPLIFPVLFCIFFEITAHFMRIL